MNRRDRHAPLLSASARVSHTYLPEHFAERDTGELHRLIREYPLGVLVVNGRNGLEANHLPFELDPAGGEHGRLLTHVARANPVWEAVADGDEVLVIFRAADAYISPNWYPSKHEFHRQVPTWYYLAVHARGRVAVRDDERFVRGVVARLTRVREAQVGAERPWRMTHSAPEYIDGMLSAIVGIEVTITELLGKWKLSQNKEARDQASAAQELSRRGEGVISRAMRRGEQDEC